MKMTVLGPIRSDRISSLTITDLQLVVRCHIRILEESYAPHRELFLLNWPALANNPLKQRWEWKLPIELPLKYLEGTEIHECISSLRVSILILRRV
jgi:hypothetical protein